MNNPPNGLASGSILIVDDTPENLRILSEMLRQRGYLPRPVTSGKLALQAMQAEPPDLILLDVTMPEMDGYEVCLAVKADPRLSEIPVIFVSALTETFDKVKAFSVGGVDYITKPFQLEEVYARIETHLKVGMLQKELAATVQNLEKRVQVQVKEISESQIATIFALAKLAEFRDSETGKHLDRVRSFCKLLATHLGQHSAYAGQINGAFVEDIYHASPLHDIGKVGIRDEILLKPGKLTPEEFEVMKTHSILGYETLAAVARQYPYNRMINMGMDIARWHHERWDGSGYPDGLVREATPLPARIMALADVYDAARSRRVYKPAFSHAETRDIISGNRASHLDPLVVDTFFSLQDEFGRMFEVLSGGVAV